MIKVFHVEPVCISLEPSNWLDRPIQITIEYRDEHYYIGESYDHVFAYVSIFGIPDSKQYTELATILAPHYDAFMNLIEAKCEIFHEQKLDNIEMLLAKLAFLVAPLTQKLIPLPDIVKDDLLTCMEQYRRQMPNLGYVYLVRAVHPDHIFKIGYSKTPIQRIDKLNVKLPFPIDVIHLIPTNNMRQAESKLHNQFASVRVEGEWFELTPDDVKQIRDTRYLYIESAS